MLENATGSYVYRFYDQVAQKRSQNLTTVTKIHSGLSTIEFLAVNETIFTQLLMNRKEKCISVNHEI